MYQTNQFRKNLKIEVEGIPYTIVDFQFVSPGKGGAFVRTKLKNMLKVFKSSPRAPQGARSRSKSKKKNAIALFLKLLWAGEDLNLHALRRYLLRVVCLPFHHPPKGFYSSTNIRKSRLDLNVKIEQKKISF